MGNDTPDTWDEIMQRNEQELRDLEARILASRHRELTLWKDGKFFAIGKSPVGHWWAYVPHGSYYHGDSLQDVLEQAMLHGYTDIFEWSGEWNER